MVLNASQKEEPCQHNMHPTDTNLLDGQQYYDTLQAHQT